MSAKVQRSFVMNVVRKKLACVSAQHVRRVCRAATNWKDVLDNPFYEKYKKKLEKIQGTPEKFVKAEKAPPDMLSRPFFSPVQMQNEALDQVMKVELIEHKSKDEIAQIWVEYHKTKNCVSAIILSDSYLQLQAKAMHCPMFVYPLPRNEGYEIWLSQFSGQKCYFTSLINYQTFQENAPHSFVLTHYTEFLETKGLVLARGEVDPSHLNTLEAQTLTNQMQLYYASQRADLYAMVRQFNHDPQHFDYKQLIEQLNNLSL